MLEDYLKKLETIISPQTYDLNNYKEKILQSSISFPDRKFVQGLNSESQVNEVFQNKEKDAFQKALNDMEEVNRSQRPEMDNTNLDLDQKTKNKIHSLNVKNMAYRQQIDSLNRTIEEQNRTIIHQKRTLEENQVTMENNSRYLLKLESYLVEAGKAKARERFTLNLIGVSSSFAEECRDKNNKASFTVEKADLKELVVSLVNENQKLREFQNNVVALSKQFDDINEHVVDSLKNIQEKLYMAKNDNKFASKIDNMVLNDIDENLNKVLFCVDETLKTKHQEFQLLLEKKDEELAFLRKEIVILNEKIENSKRDRLKDQKNMIEIECQNAQLINEIEELQKTIHENYTKLKLLDSENISSKIQVSTIHL